MKTIELTIFEQVRKKKKFEFSEHSIVPGWLSNDTCPVCHWGLHEDQYSQYIMAAKTKEGNYIRFFHPDCFNR